LLSTLSVILPLFITLTEGNDSLARRPIILHSVLTVTLVTLIFALAGSAFLRLLGITSPIHGSGRDTPVHAVADRADRAASNYTSGQRRSGCRSAGGPLVAGQRC